MNEQNPISGSETDEFMSSLQQLFTYTKMDAIVGQMAQAFMMQAKNAISAKSESADPAALAQTLTFFEEEYQAEVPSLMTDVAGLYKSVFTKDDIDGVLNFYASEAGQKFIQGGAHVEQKLQGLTQVWAQSAGKAAFDRATARVNKI